MSKIKHFLHNYLRVMYHKVPLPLSYKVKLKTYYNSNLKFLTHDISYQEWQNINAAVDSSDIDPCIDTSKYLQELFDRTSKKSLEYVPISETSLDLTENDIKLIAFYLPQFHPVKENNEWWGRGFTEWTNVSKALPQFTGHYQPHLPGELGFYDLRLVEIQQRQIELAKQYGLYGFCYYYYWFSGKCLLERPLQQILDHPELDFPFSVCWANENWSRRWDGMESDLLMEQRYSPEDDIAFIESLVPLMKDRRYIRVKNKPMLMVYRVGLFPEPKATAERWRNYCRNAGIGEIYLIAVQGLDFINPVDCGFDAAAEFPPHTVACPNITDKVPKVNPDFAGIIYDFKSFIKSKCYVKPSPYTLFKGVFPSWDNTARKPNNGVVFWGANPGLYKEWLTDTIKYTKNIHDPNEQIVFVNAWNEWGEGAHLEPDRKYGYAYLQATADAIRQTRDWGNTKKIVCVAHDAHPHGAQILMLNMIKTLTEHFHYEVHLLLKSGGRLEEEYARYAAVYNLETEYPTGHQRNELVYSLYKQDIKIAICNTVVAGDLVKILTGHGFRTISLVHELPGVIAQYGIEKHAQEIAQYAHKVIFPSTFVEEKFRTVATMDHEKPIICAQGLYEATIFNTHKEEARIRLRQRLNLPSDAKIALGVGYADLRKGIDLFVEVAQKTLAAGEDIYFVWLGDLDISLQETIIEQAKAVTRPQNMIFVPFQSAVSDFYVGADVYLMTSREDPFPSVVLESMAGATPVIGFSDAGGFRDIITPDTGALVPFLDTESMTEKLIEWMKSPEVIKELGGNGARLIREEYKFIDYIYQLLSLLGHHYEKVSAVIPNYNYDQYLEKRLYNVQEQNYPLYDIIVLDDASADSSQHIAQEFVEKHTRLAKLYSNERNSGSVFRQWSKGVDLASGDYIWIAEADDVAEPNFVEEVMKGFSHPEVILSYTQSKQMDEQGNILAPDYLEYTNDIDNKKWKSNYVQDGQQEIIKALVVKNTIPNVSAVIFKKIDISQIIEKMMSYKVAGDWLFYVWLLSQGNIAYCNTALNHHRRHSNSVTISANGENLFQEICRMQDYIMENYPIDNESQYKTAAYREKVKKILLG